jgi:tungstate transport system ATP-binding protein
VAEYLDLFGISHLRNRSARSLSGGEAQRTNLARAFATKPRAIFLDEPFASLDPGSREPLIDDIQRVLEKTKTTTLLVTHDLMEALRLSDRIAVMGRGRIHQIDTPDEVMNRPVDETVAAFVSAGTVLAGLVIEKRRDTFVVAVNSEEIESAGAFGVGESVGLYIRPENVTLSIGLNAVGQKRVTGARNVFPATIVRIMPLGFYEKVLLDCGFPLVSYVTHQSRKALELREGQRVSASFEATAIHVIARGRREPPEPSSC